LLGGYLGSEEKAEEYRRYLRRRWQPLVPLSFYGPEEAAREQLRTLDNEVRRIHAKLDKVQTDSARLRSEMSELPRKSAEIAAVVVREDRRRG
jgi:hypothetical protein